MYSLLFTTGVCSLLMHFQNWSIQQENRSTCGDVFSRETCSANVTNWKPSPKHVKHDLSSEVLCGTFKFQAISEWPRGSFTYLFIFYQSYKSLRYQRCSVLPPHCLSLQSECVFRCRLDVPLTHQTSWQIYFVICSLSDGGCVGTSMNRLSIEISRVSSVSLHFIKSP